MLENKQIKVLDQKTVKHRENKLGKMGLEKRKKSESKRVTKWGTTDGIC